MTFVNPYPGIRPFGINDSRFFFGREDQIKELQFKLLKVNFLAVVGYSGSGKSSLIRAGLIPRLHSGWRVALFRPEGSPILNLAKALNSQAALGGFTDNAFTEINLNYSSRGILETINYSKYEGKLLLVIDQFEELFRFKNQNRDEAIRFINLITATVNEQDTRVSIIIIMRSDFLGSCTEFKGLPELINEGQFLIPRLTRNQYKESIVEPLREQGILIAPSLVSRLLNDIGNDPDQLPVLQHSLMLTFNEWLKFDTTIPIDISHYESIGGVESGISYHCDQIFADLKSNGHADSVIKIFQRLTDINEEGVEIRRPSTLAELISINHNRQNEVIEIINSFRREDRNFLVPSFEKDLTLETVVDISHECLMRKWTNLHKWILLEEDNKRILLRLVNQYQSFLNGESGTLNNVSISNYLAWGKYKEFKADNSLGVSREVLNWSTRYTSEFTQAIKFIQKSKVRNSLRKRIFYAIIALALIATAFLIRFEIRSLEDSNALLIKQNYINNLVISKSKDLSYTKSLQAENTTLKEHLSLLQSNSTLEESQLREVYLKAKDENKSLKDIAEKAKGEAARTSTEIIRLKSNLEEEETKNNKISRAKDTELYAIKDSLNQEKILKDGILFEVILQNPDVASLIKAKFKKLVEAKKLNEKSRRYIQNYVNNIDTITNKIFGSADLDSKILVSMRIFNQNKYDSIRERLRRDGFRGDTKIAGFFVDYERDNSFYIISSDANFKGKLQKMLAEKFKLKPKSKTPSFHGVFIDTKSRDHLVTQLIIDLK